MPSEAVLQIQVADYLRLQYPDVMFHSDFGSGIKLTPGQAVKQKRQNGGRRAWPDMMIAEPTAYASTGWKDGRRVNRLMDAFSDQADDIYCGLYLEFKKERETLYPGPRSKNRYRSKDGKEYKTEHLMEQANCLHDLRQRGYCAEFAIGFEEAKKKIDEYLGGK